MFDKILVPLDRSLLAECVLPHAFSIAQALNARITLLTVLDPHRRERTINVIDPYEWNIRKAIAEAYLEEKSVRLRQSNLEVETILLEGIAADTIIRHVRDHQFGLIALSSHGRSGLSGWNISSVVQKVILRASTSALIVPAYHPTPAELADLHYQCIVVPLDGSMRAEYVLPIARRIAAFNHATLVLVHVVSRPEMPSRVPLMAEEVEMADKIVECNRQRADLYLTQTASQLSAETIDVKTRLLGGKNPLRALHEMVEEECADLVIMNAHGYSGDSPWPYGSVTLSFIIYGAHPVLIIQDLPAEQIAATQAEIATKETPKH
jgi:nucleotide-binding universal stress UspA family protein